MPYIRNADGKLARKSMSVSDVFEKIRSENVKFIDLQFTDVPGKLHHVTVPTHTINENSFSIGIPKLDGSSIRGFTGINESDMLLKPDPNTFVIVPWSNPEAKYARLLCSVYWGQGVSTHKGEALEKDLKEKKIRSSSEPFALLMAEKVCEIYGSNWGIGETGAAGPTGNGYGDPPGYSCLAVYGEREISTHVLTNSNNRRENMEAFALAALDLFIKNF